MRMHQVWAAATRVAGVHVRAHQVAIRNAMVASSALTQRRLELDEVEEFLVQHRRAYDAHRVVTPGRHRSA